MADRPPTRRDVRAADVHAGLDLLDKLTEQGTSVASIKVTPTELVVEAAADVTPPEGVAALRHIDTDPGTAVTIDRHPGWADLAAKFAGRHLRVRVHRRGGQ